MLLVRQTLEEAVARAEDFRMMCVREPILVGEIIMPITVSIGLAAFDPDNHRDGDGLYRAADSAVYQAKNSGRNRVCCQEPAVV